MLLLIYTKHWILRLYPIDSKSSLLFHLLFPWCIAWASVMLSFNMKRLQILNPSIDSINWDSCPRFIPTSDYHCCGMRNCNSTGKAVMKMSFISTIIITYKPFLENWSAVQVWSDKINLCDFYSAQSLENSLSFAIKLGWKIIVYN